MKEIDIKDISNKDIYEILKNLNLPNAYITFQSGDGFPSLGTDSIKSLIFLDILFISSFDTL